MSPNNPAQVLGAHFSEQIPMWHSVGWIGGIWIIATTYAPWYGMRASVPTPRAIS